VSHSTLTTDAFIRWGRQAGLGPPFEALPDPFSDMASKRQIKRLNDSSLGCMEPLVDNSSEQETWRVKKDGFRCFSPLLAPVGSRPAFGCFYECSEPNHDAWGAEEKAKRKTR
jgi:hypothetical protein